MFKNTTELMGLKEKTLNFLLFSGTTKSLRNHQRIRNPWTIAKLSLARPVEFSSIFRTLNVLFLYLYVTFFLWVLVQ